jgi:cyanophycinase
VSETLEPADAADAANAADLAGTAGRLIAIGGLADRTRERDLLRAFFEAAGGPDANIVVLALATEPAELRDPAAAAERFGDVFYDLGAESVEVLRLGAALGSSRLDLLEYATGLFLAGSGPSWLPLPEESLLSEAVRRRHAAGMVVGGNGAGAAVLPELCIAPGPGSAMSAMSGTSAASAASGGGAGSGRRRPPGLVPGLGLARGLLLDPPLRQRDRLGRLLAAVAADPSPLAVGIDEDTAVVIEAGRSLEVLGTGAVMVVDATQAVRPGLAAGDLPAMLGVRVDVLTAGCTYDLRERRARPGSAHGANDWTVPASDKPQGE